MEPENEFEKKNFYQRLGVARDASTAQIKEAYKEIARVYHPDSNYFGEIIDYDLSDSDNKIFQLVTIAYDTLIKDEKRSAYDKSLPRDNPEEVIEPSIKGTKPWVTETYKRSQLKVDEKVKVKTQVANSQIRTTIKPKEEKVEQTTNFEQYAEQLKNEKAKIRSDKPKAPSKKLLIVLSAALILGLLGLVIFLKL